MRFAYADPPYPGMAHLYKGHLDYAGEVDHKALIERLVNPGGESGMILPPFATWLCSVCPVTSAHQPRPAS